MPNLRNALAEEIRRLARKEIKVQTKTLHSSLTRYRKDIAALKRKNAALDRQISRLAKGGGAVKKSVVDEDAPRPRFSSAWVKKHRDKLGLSAADYGALVGVAGLTIYNWEKGVSQPQTRQLHAWGAVRTLGKREAWRRLEAMEG